MMIIRVNAEILSFLSASMQRKSDMPEIIDIHLARIAAGDRSHYCIAIGSDGSFVLILGENRNFRAHIA